MGLLCEQRDHSSIYITHAMSAHYLAPIYQLGGDQTDDCFERRGEAKIKNKLGPATEPGFD